MSDGNSMEDFIFKVEEVFEGEVAENIKKSVPQWTSILQYMLEQTGKENRLSISFSDGSTIEYVAPHGESYSKRMEKLQMHIDYWKVRCKDVLRNTDYNENGVSGEELFQEWVDWAEDAEQDRY